MKILVLPMFVLSVVSAVVGSPPTTNSIAPIVYLLGALLAGSGAGAVVNIYRTRKLGKFQADQLIANAMNEAVAAAQIMLSEHRIELEKATEIKSELTDLLVKRNETISDLEDELKKTTGEKIKLKKELLKAVEELAQTKAQEHHLKEIINSLKIKIATLEGITDVET